MKYLLTILIIIGLCICSISPVMAAETQEESDDIIIPDEEREEESDDIIIPDEKREEESDDIIIPDEEREEESDDIIIPDEEREEESDDIIIPDEEREEESDEQYTEFYIDRTIVLNSKVVVKPTNGKGPVFERHTHGILPMRLLLPKSIDEWTIEYYSGAPWKKTRNLKLTSYGQIKLSDYPEGCWYLMECWRLDTMYVDVFWGRGEWVGCVALTDVKK